MIRAFILLTGVFIVLQGRAQLSAEFTADVQSGCGDLLVNFTDQSTGNPNSWDWDFGDGSANSSLQHPSHFYSSPGTYTVTLTVSGGGNSDTETKTAYIVVHEEPTVDFSVSDSAGCSPLTVSFSDSSTPGDASITNWEWDFGDGTVSNQQNPNHTYSSGGTYNVSLFVTDANGCTDVLVKNDLIEVDPKPDADFGVNDTLFCSTPAQVNFSDSSSGSNLTYEWKFGDGDSSSAQNPSHDYNSFGSFNPELIVTNDVGCSDTASINILNQELQADLSMDSTIGCDSLEVSFQDQSSPSPNDWVWDFGDGDSSSLQDPTHIYSDTGSYTVTLITSNSGGCSDTLTLNDTIDIHPLPQIGFTATDTSACSVPLSSSFSDTTSGAVAWSWEFGDGDSSSLQSPTHTYDSAGIYDVSLSVTDSNGCQNSVTDTGRIRIIEPVADFTVDTSSGCQPLTVNFTDLSFSNEAISSWSWDLGDGTSSSMQNPTHTYSDTGSYTVSLAIENVEGCSDTVIKLDTIEVGQPPQAGFTPTDTVGCHPFTVPFTDTSSDYTDEWHWSFGDGGMSDQQNPSHTYNVVDTFDVQLVAGFHGCYDTLTQNASVQVLPPKAQFDVTPIVGCDTPHTVSFSNVTPVSDYWHWTFGDGTSFNGQNPAPHTYDQPGSYQVELAVKDSTQMLCRDTGTVVVQVSTMEVGFTQDTTVGCNPTSIAFTDSSQANFGLEEWEWHFGDGDSIGPSSGSVSSPQTSGTFQDPVHTYTNDSLYDVTLIATDSLGCRDTANKPQLIDIKPLPEPSFIADTTFGCAPLTVSFTDQSSPDSLISGWNWDFGDGDSSSLQDPTHTYSDTGDFNVSLSVSDSFNCEQGSTATALIHVTHPTASFTYDSVICDGDTVSFTSNSVGEGIYHVWNYGDGSSPDTVSGNSTEHYYDLGANSDTTLQVTLIAVDSNGCIDSLQRALTISVPQADFTVDSTSIDCPPFNADFLDLSSGNVSQWQWSFGDSSGTSSVQNPSHTYSIAGYFDVGLIITTPEGCSDTLVKDSLIHVGGPQGTFTYSIDSSGCFYEVTFYASTTNTDSIEWIFDDGAKGSGDTVTHTYEDPGVYDPFMLISDGQGCQVAIPSPAPIDIPPSGYSPGFSTTNATCEASDGSMSANPSGGNPPYSFQWSTGDSGSTVNGVPAGTYGLVVTDSLGCTYTDSVTVGMDEPVLNFSFSSDSATCTDNDGSASVTVSGGSSPYSYQWNNGQTGDSLSNVPTGTYAVTVTDSNGCTGTDSVTVPQKTPSVNAVFSTDTNGVYTGDPIRFIDSSSSSLPIDIWKWRFGDGDLLIDSSGAVVEHAYNDAGSFQAELVVITSKGCTDTARKLIDILSFIEVPNVFTPNRDGKNDRFKVRSSGLERFSLRIYNRWGQLLFRSEEPGHAWSGRNIAGEKAPEGTYFYLLKYRFTGDNEMKKEQGEVNLFR
ncbi:MAG: PKD domain-containing protein [Flavobacteriales bacterium]